MTIVNSDAVQIRDDIYCKTPEALEQALGDLRKMGYIKVVRKDNANGWPYWNAAPDVARKAKCNTCHHLMDDTAAINSHGHTCEACGTVLYLQIVEDTNIQFFFDRDEPVGFGPKLRMQVIHWDYEDGWLYLKPELLESHNKRSLMKNVIYGEQGKQYLNKYSSYWELVELDGTKALKVRHTRNDEGYDFRRDIGIAKFEKQYENYKIVRIWNGTEYGEYGRLPLHESVTLYETWHQAPLEPTPTLHERIIQAAYLISEVDYYTPGQEIWHPKHYEDMGIFIRHFTTLNADEWDRLSLDFPLDGPGGIAAVRAFCRGEIV